MNLEAFFLYKNQLMNDLLTNEEIVRLLHDDCKLIEHPEDLMYKQVFPYEFIPDTVEHGQTFICCDVDVQKAISSMELQPMIYIWEFTHQSKLRLPNGGGVRTDALANEIAKAINGSLDYGLGRLELYAVRRFAPIAGYLGRQMTFQARDVNLYHPVDKPIPSNRMYG